MIDLIKQILYDYLSGFFSFLKIVRVTDNSDIFLLLFRLFKCLIIFLTVN